MRKLLLLGTAVLGLGLVWYIVTNPSGEEARPGGMSNHEVDQTFDPYLTESRREAPVTDASPVDEAGEPGTSEDPPRENLSERDGDDASLDNGAVSDPTADTPRAKTDGDGADTHGDGADTHGDGADTHGDGAHTRGDGSGTVPAESSGGSVPDSHELSAADARRIADEYLSNASTNPDRLLDRYAERVNYYDEGTVDRSDVLRDKRTYLERWPERSYRRVSDIQITDAGAADLIRFTYEFRVSGESRNAEGRGWAELGLQRSDGDLVIVSERGGVID